MFEKHEAATGAYFSGRCLAFTTDASGLASIRNKEAKDPDEHVILPELISKEPLGPAVRRGDDEWFAIAKWVIFGLIEAEEYGITQANVDKMKTESQDPVVMRIARHLRGHRQAARPRQGVDGRARSRRSATTARSSSATSGPKTPLALPRGVNNLWNKGGLHVRAAGTLTDARPVPRAPDDGSRARRPSASATGRWRSQAFRGAGLPGARARG